MTEPTMSLSEAKQLNASACREIMRSSPLDTDVFYTEVKSESVAFEISLLGRDQVLFWKVYGTHY